MRSAGALVCGASAGGKSSRAAETTNKENPMKPTKKILWPVAFALILAVATTGCATKKYVKQETGAVSTRVVAHVPDCFGR